MKHIVCLTKSYNYADLAVWFGYHSKLGYRIHLIDNESDSEISCRLERNLVGTTKHTYERLKGWPNQWQLFNDILNGNRYGFQTGDLVAFVDDDEYLWYHLDYWKLVEQYRPEFKGKIYEPMEDFVTNQMKRQTDMNLPGCVLIPQILMGTHDFMGIGERTEPYVHTHFYRRNDTSSQGKSILRYDPKFCYDFTVRSGDEYGHVPVIWDSTKISKSHAIRNSLVNGVGVSKTTYGDVDYGACLRLYHYHIKSEMDWRKKISRGSAAIDHQWYASDVHANKYFGGYDTVDFTMLETLKLMGL